MMLAREGFAADARNEAAQMAESVSPRLTVYAGGAVGGGFCSTRDWIPRNAERMASKSSLELCRADAIGAASAVEGLMEGSTAGVAATVALIGRSCSYVPSLCPARPARTAACATSRSRLAGQSNLRARPAARRNTLRGKALPTPAVNPMGKNMPPAAVFAGSGLATKNAKGTKEKVR